MALATPVAGASVVPQISASASELIDPVEDLPQKPIVPGVEPALLSNADVVQAPVIAGKVPQNVPGVNPQISAEGSVTPV